MNAYMGQYKNNQILTASPEQILIMLYDGAIRFCRQAMNAMDEGQKTLQGEKIDRAMAIICEFSNTLDHGVGGEIAENLDALYGFMTRELIRANLQNDRKALETVESLLGDLRETWAEAIELNRKESPQPAAVGGNDSSHKHVAASF